jgi:hypothetical protein
MTRASRVDAEIDLAALPVLDGAAETSAAGQCLYCGIALAGLPESGGHWAGSADRGRSRTDTVEIVALARVGGRGLCRVSDAFTFARVPVAAHPSPFL